MREVAERFGIKVDMVYYWIEQGWLPARRQHPHRAWRIVLNPEKEKELWQRIKNSPHAGQVTTDKILSLRWPGEVRGHSFTAGRIHELTLKC